MIGTVAALLLVQPTRILFLGNSHTAVNDIPGMVKHLFEHDGRQIIVDRPAFGLLNDIDKDARIRESISKDKWDYVVLQGASLSSSHKYTYRQDGAIDLANTARRAGTKAVFFAEWGRRGWQETDFILGVYKKIAAKTQADIARVCVSWDRAIRRRPGLDMWAADGNHAQLSGSYLAALTLYYHLGGDRKKLAPWTPPGVGTGLGNVLREAALSECTVFRD